MLQLNTALIVLPFLLSFITGKSSIYAPVEMRLGVKIKYTNIKNTISHLSQKPLAATSTSAVFESDGSSFPVRGEEAGPL